MLSEAEVLQTANEYKSGSYDPERYRFPKYDDIIKLLHTDPDVTNQLLNSALRGSNCSSRGPKDNFFYKIFFPKRQIFLLVNYFLSLEIFPRPIEHTYIV